MRPWVRVALVATAYASLLWAPAFVSPSATGFGDWQMIHHNLEAALASVRAGDLPLWDPYHCGGVTSLGNPESQHFAPWILLLALTVGSTLATKLLLVAHAAIGAAGAFRYARARHGVGVPAACLTAGAWAGSGFLSWQLAGGHFTFVPYYLFPFLLLTWRRCLVDPRAIGPLAAILAVVVFEGGTYPLPHALLALALDAAFALGGGRGQEPPAAVRATFGRACVHGAAAVALVVALTAVRWLPVLETLALFPRAVSSTDAPAALDLARAWVVAEGEWRSPDRLYVWPEYCAFVGWPVVALAALGVPRALRSHRAVLVGLAVFFVLAMGSFHPWAPWALLHRLPLYDSIRVPSRLQVLVTLYLALLAGIGLDTLVRSVTRWLGQRDWWQGTAWGLVLLALAPVVAFNLANNARWNGAAVESADPPAARFHLVSTPDYHGRYALLPRERRGTRSCYVGAMAWPVARGLWNGDRPQAQPDHGTLLGAWRSPNAVHVHVRMGAPGLVRINQNFHPDWQPSVGVLRDLNGSMAVDLPAGEHRLTVSYEPPSWWWGSALSALGLLGLLVTARRSRRSGPSVVSRRDP